MDKKAADAEIKTKNNRIVNFFKKGQIEYDRV